MSVRSVQAQSGENDARSSQYLRADRNVPNPQRNVIYLFPVGAFPATAPPLAQLAKIVHAFFMLKVKTLPAVNVDDVAAKTRINEGTKKRQLFAPEVLGWLRKRLPDDAFGLVAVTMEDLYPEPSWNFVFGMASLKERVGVHSLARQDPAFFGEPRPDAWQTLARRRATWTLVHEISHMFGLTHCTYWRCVVAGSNSQDERIAARYTRARCACASCTRRSSSIPPRARTRLPRCSAGSGSTTKRRGLLRGRRGSATVFVRFGDSTSLTA